MTAEPTFLVKRLAQAYRRGRLALDLTSDGAPLALAGGGINVVLGPNGCGKTTFLRLLGLIDPPVEAEGSIFGHPWPWGNGSGWGAERQRMALRRRMAFIFQRPVLFEGTVAGNVAYGLRLRGLDGGSPEVRARVEESLAQVGLVGFAPRAAKGLSSGESQRVALARAMAFRPEVFLLDEPTANLDPASASAIEGLLKRLRAEGRTIVLVTHNLFQARRLADRVLFLSEGRLVEDAPAGAFFERPATEAARAFAAGETVF
ncbi:MAG TPA: phosphate ABC transporter ATP-binding protein [Bacillota bacterium]|jgi:tungstate transport system ATP-binding protein